jgi:Hus1-like protein
VPPTLPKRSKKLKGKLGAHENTINHLVTTKVLESQYAQSEKEPTLPQEDVHIMLPWPADTLRTVSDRYKSLSHKLFVLANTVGELELRVESDEVKVETKWKGLVNPRLGTPWVSLGC